MIEEIRFRVKGELCVLQVRLYEESYSGYTTPTPKWRDAKVEDLLEVGKIINGTSYSRTDPNAPTVNWSQS